MADIRLTPATPSPTPVQRVGRPEAVRAAQAAFFQQALKSAGAPTAARAVQPASAARAAPSPAATPLIFDADAPPPSRPLRPGSLLDIKV